MEAVENVACLDAVLVGEYFPAVEVFVCRKGIVGHQTQYYPEEVLLAFDRFFGEIECGVAVFFQVDGSVYDAHPLAVGIGDRTSVIAEEILHSVGHDRSGGLAFVASGAVTRVAAADDASSVLG